MKGLIVKDGIVQNVAEFDTPDELFEGWQIAPEGVGIGWTEDEEGSFSPPIPPEPEPLTPEEIKAQQKLEGVDFDGVMCSATSEDMWGLASIKDWIRAGQSTNFEFQNGNVLTLDSSNIDAFEAVWVPFRASFF